MGMAMGKGKSGGVRWFEKVGTIAEPVRATQGLGDLLEAGIGQRVAEEIVPGGENLHLHQQLFQAAHPALDLRAAVDPEHEVVHTGLELRGPGAIAGPDRGDDAVREAGVEDAAAEQQAVVAGRKVVGAVEFVAIEQDQLRPALPHGEEEIAVRGHR
ncbi:unannotated protein [freshwater metagenome]|uniref:Unannotated protein n=1 Tax=freshwater metagenome TaxID=449393 RepID=A0A6J6CL40_9ZZZZ